MDGDVEAETHHLMVKPLSPSCLPGASRGLCAAIKQGGWGEWQKLMRDRKRENGQGNVHKETRWDLV